MYKWTTFKKTQKIYSLQPCRFIFLNIKCFYQSVDWLVTKMLMNKTGRKYYMSFIFFFQNFKIFFNRNWVQTIAFLLRYFIQKRLHRTHILRSPLFHYNQGDVFFPHKYSRNTIDNTYAKIIIIKIKITEPIFQTATRSLN